MDLRIIIVFCVITISILYESNADIACESNPFLERCMQRKVSNRTNGQVTISSCNKDGSFSDDKLVLLAVKTGNLSFVLTNTMKIQLETNRSADEQSQTCLFQKLRPHVTGYRAFHAIVDYQGCVITNTFGYIVLEYTCIKDMSMSISGIAIPQCNRTIQGRKIPIINVGYPYEGFPNITSDCKCSIDTVAPFINITTYAMELGAEQSISILNQTNKVFNVTNMSMEKSRETTVLSVNGPLYLAWTTHFMARNSTFKFWMELQANGTNITINCDQHMSTISPTKKTTKKPTPEISTYYAGSRTTIKPTGQPLNDTLSSVTRTITLVSPDSQTTSSISDPSTVETQHSSSETSTESLPITKMHLTNFSIDTTSKQRVAASTADSDGSKFPVIPVVIGIVAFLILLLTIILIIVCCKRHKDKKKQADSTEKDKRDSDQDESKGTADERDENKDAPVIGDKLSTPLLPDFNAPMVTQISNSGFDMRRLQPLFVSQRDTKLDRTQARDTNLGNTQTRDTNRGNTQTRLVNEIDAIMTKNNFDETQINVVNEEYGEDGTKKKKKKKRKHKNKVHPVMGDDDLDAGESKPVEDQDTSLTV